MEEKGYTRIQVDVRIVPFGAVQIKMGNTNAQDLERLPAPQAEDALHELPQTASSVTGMIWAKNSAALVL